MRTHIGTVNYNDYINLLNCFRSYDYNQFIRGFEFTFVLSDKRLAQLREKYALHTLTASMPKFRFMVELMIWVHSKLNGDGACVPPTFFSADYVLSNSSSGLHSNCYMYAVVLTELFLAVGLPARMVRCMPLDIDYNDCHCVVEAFCSDYEKWIIFDPANRAYYINRKALPLNLFELREHIAQQYAVYVPMMSIEMTNSLLKYWAKNLIRFESYKISQYGNELFQQKSTLFHFQPSNYPISDKEVYYEKYNCFISHIHTSNPALYWAPPLNII